MKTWQIVLVTLLIVAVLLVGLIAAGVGAVMWAIRSAGSPQNVEIVIDMPDTVRQDERFTFTIRIDNTATRQQTLDSIDVSNSFLDVVRLIAFEPSHVGTMQLRTLNETSYDFNRIAIPSGGSLLITATAQAQSAMNLSSYLDVCINNGNSCRTVPIAVNIE